MCLDVRILIPDASQRCFFPPATEIYDFQSLIVFNNLILTIYRAAEMVGIVYPNWFFFHFEFSDT